jgi:tungstate transport system substrate-binding protein
MQWRRRILDLCGLVIVLAALGTSAAAQPEKRSLILATTTSTQDSGLLDVLLPVFEAQSGYVVKPIAVGTGEALAMGARGEADVLLVHAPEAEAGFMAAGHGVHRRAVMHNDFILVGPPEDPARLGGSRAILDALKRLVRLQVPFVSRGDRSGTHMLELGLWRQAGVTPTGAWYLEAGQGMGETLRIAAEKHAYTLTDRGTYLALQKSLHLTVVTEGDRSLANFYSVIEVNATRHPKVHTQGAKAFADFLVSSKAQQLIKTFGLERFGQPLFFPDGLEEEQG